MAVAAAVNAAPLVALATPAAPHVAAGPIVSARASEPVVITGAQVPQWSRSSATGAAAPYPSGATKTTGGDSVRSAHNGVLSVPPDARTGVDPDQVTAFRWDGAAWVEIPVQVDQRYPYFLANGHSSFSSYSGTDEELTYAWNPTAHSTGEEAWKKVFGDCSARYQQTAADLTSAIASGAVSPSTNPAVAADDYTQAMPDPVRTLNDDDQIAMMAGDAGVQAPPGTGQPAGTTGGSGQTITVVDPTNAMAPGYIYLFLRPGGSSFNAGNGYVQMTRDANADEWIDRYTFAPSDTEKIGTSNTGYGPNLPGTVCRTSPSNDASPPITTPDGTARSSIDRVPRDGMTVTTPTYRLYASGRWMIRQFAVTAPGTTGSYGPNLISRWKGRAFQQSPDSSVSLVGFEDEQVNWEANAALLGWKVGPVRAIREVWGADSGTNVTKTETYYRDADAFHYHVRVHPIPPDGLYTSWDYRLGAVDTYYNVKNPQGVRVDGVPDSSVGEIDQVPVTGQKAFFNSCDPTFDICSAIANPEEVAGPNGGMVYVAELSGPTSATEPAVVPYYRDDACFDDGTGDGPPPRPWPKETSTDSRVQQGYVDYWKAHGAPATLTYADLKCNPADTNPATPAWQKTPFAGAIGQSGLHFFVTSDTDNAFSPKPITEIDAQQWRYTVPMSSATNVAAVYGQNVTAPLQVIATPYGTAVAASATAGPHGASASVSASIAASVAAFPVASLLTRWRRRRAAQAG
ncbi:MAG TPA: hypothetical protein VGQ42_06850 [Candidatus Dormibacteraeota bacterium]|nr:hypothetical protein [Candidatus Dormibacteraeota bacterium]